MNSMQGYESEVSDTSITDIDMCGYSGESSDLLSDAGAEGTQAEAHTGHKKVLVTGGAGFIGSWVADALLQRGDDVIIVDEMNDYYDVNIKRANLNLLVGKYGSVRCKVFEGDISDRALMSHIFATEEPGWVCHLAARAGVRPSIEDPILYVQSNVNGTTLLLELANKHKVQHFVYASSSSVYGGSKLEVFGEDDVVDFPVSPYAATKKACELLAHTYHHLYKMHVAGLRFFTVYGPRGRPDMAPFKFTSRVCRGEELLQFGDGTSSRDYTYITDIVDGVIRSLDRPLGYQVYNLGRGEPVRLTTFINLVEKAVGKQAIIKVLPDQPGDVPRTCADISKAQKLLGYAPKVPFEEGIRCTVEWFRSEYLPSIGTRQAAGVSQAFQAPAKKAVELEGPRQSRQSSCPLYVMG
ncbi:unnamed protein product [Chrysoparadoxa australica]